MQQEQVTALRESLSDAFGLNGTILEQFRSDVIGRGMHFQAEAVERLVAEGNLRGDLLTIDESVAIMGTLDTIREQIGLRYPGE